MIRMSILSVAFLALMSTTATPAEEPKKAEDKQGFRVYTIVIKCGNRRLEGIYASPAEAFQAANKLRAKVVAMNVEVTTGSEGKLVPTGRPMLYEVYMRTCRSGWRKQGLFADEKNAKAVAKTHETKGAKVEIVRDYAPKEVYHIYGGLTRQGLELLGTYVTLEKAAAKEFLTNGTNRERSKDPCVVTTGTKGHDYLGWGGAPTQYKVYVKSCKGWSLVATKSDEKNALEVVEAQRKKTVRAEVVLVHHYGVVAK